MTILEEAREFLKNILHWFYLLVGLSVFFFSFNFEKVLVFGKHYFIPFPSDISLSVQIFNKIQHDLLPPEVHLIVTNPLNAFTSQIVFSILLAFLISFPFFLYRIIAYISPALFEHEKKAILKSLIPSSVLFFTGALFAYFFIIPSTFKLLYPYAIAIEATTFFSLNEFINSVIGLMISTGVMFLLPLFIILISFFGIVHPEFWKDKWRYALLFFLIFSAIITPDGTGITMAMLFVPLMILYFFGYYFSSNLKKYKIKNTD